MGSSNSLMFQEMGLKAVTGIAGAYVGIQERKIAQIQRDFQNNMAALSAAQSKNQVTRNEASIRDQAAFAETANQIAGAQDVEAMRVAAATVGASGNSVNTTLGAGARAIAQRRLGLELELDGKRAQAQDQRREIALSQVYNKNISIIPNQIGTQLMGVAASLLDVYKDYQPQTHNLGG